MGVFRPTIRSNFWLGVLAVVFIICFIWVQNSFVTVRSRAYNEKFAAAQTMVEAMHTLEEHRLPQLVSSHRGGNDPLIYTLVGEKDSPITTDEGDIEEKITVLNPNLAAVILELFLQAGVEREDTVAVLLTGSLPGANIAVFSAAKALNLHLVTQTSVGSSWWGANSPDFTWLDMEAILAEQEIFSYRSAAVSFGGSDDNGGLRLSELGRQMILDAADRNEIPIIATGSLSENISERVRQLRSLAPNTHFKAVVNVGGGIAALGHRENADLIPLGLNMHLPVKNYPGLGVIHYLAEDGAPIIQVHDIKKFARKFDLPVADLPLPSIGQGEVFEQKRYNLVVAYIAFLLMLAILVIVKYLDYRIYKWREERVDPDAVI